MKKHILRIISIVLILATIICCVFMTSSTAVAANNYNYLSEDQTLYIGKNLNTTPDADGNYTITLDAYDSVITEYSNLTKPIDIIIYIDHSLSMSGDPMKFARNSAISLLSKMNEENLPAGSRFMIKCFYKKVKNVYPKEIAEDEGSSIDSFKEINNVNINEAINKVSNISCDLSWGNTRTDKTFTTAKKAFEAQSNNTRTRIAMVITDGMPGVNSIWGNGDFNNLETFTYTANAAKNLKAIGANIAIFGADTHLLNISTLWDLRTAIDSGEYIKNAITGTLLLNLVSSNYDNKDEYGRYYQYEDEDFKSSSSNLLYNKLGNYTAKKTSYYLNGDPNTDYTDELIQLFKVSAAELRTCTTIDETPYLVDTVSQYFELIPNSFKYYKVPYGVNGDYCTLTGSATFAETIRNRRFNENAKEEITGISETHTVNPDGTTKISFSGWSTVNDKFIISDNEVSEEHFGYKLQISFKVRPKDEFLGGYNVPTNVPTTSGITNSTGAFIANFCNESGIADSPKVSVSIPSLNLITPNINVKVGCAYSTTELLSQSYYTYRGRYSSNIYTIKDNGIWNVYDGTSLINYAKDYVDIENPYCTNDYNNYSTYTNAGRTAIGSYSPHYSYIQDDAVKDNNNKIIFTGLSSASLDGKGCVSFKKIDDVIPTVDGITNKQEPVNSFTSTNYIPVAETGDFPVSAGTQWSNYTIDVGLGANPVIYNNQAVFCTVINEDIDIATGNINNISGSDITFISDSSFTPVFVVSSYTQTNPTTISEGDKVAYEFYNPENPDIKIPWFYPINNCDCNFNCKIAGFQSCFHVTSDSVLTVVKRGCNPEQPEQSFKFTLYGIKYTNGDTSIGSINPIMKFVIQGNKSKNLIVDTGSYDAFKVVEEVDSGWGWDYSADNMKINVDGIQYDASTYSNNSADIDYNIYKNIIPFSSGDKKVITFINASKNSNIKYNETYCVNNYTDGTEAPVVESPHVDQQQIISKRFSVEVD